MKDKMTKIDNTNDQVLGLWTYCSQRKSSCIVPVKKVVFSQEGGRCGAEYKCCCGKKHKIIF